MYILNEYFEPGFNQSSDFCSSNILKLVQEHMLYKKSLQVLIN